MIDIHCHILPSLDDGAKSLNDSLSMAKLAVEEGITSIIATPHHHSGRYETNKNQILQEVEKLNQELVQHQIPLTILPGQEPRIYGEMVEGYHTGQLLSLNNTGKYIFVELPSNHVPRYTEKLLFDIQLQGLTPIIVHPERNTEIIENPDLLYNLVKKGAYTQVTAGSITGHFGKKIKKFSYQLIDSNLTHFLASDAHNVTNRSFKMRDAMTELEKEYGMDLIYMFRENAELVKEAKMIYADSPTKIGRKKFLGIF
ncbi:tyrosine-protein phosphatase [Litchfieldia salsa]|uniref:Tyrosine-protein phosphatase n=1 Tax=Litchfieldia salsa TaxID=930152 RepID=A0A1H0W6R6_9BACI|nr:CpsB/CapC family capsule biosynthesis tyrosine phosphatase [Litchfieldia salsa]SDP86454.1 protein-tyrosine phosphatase [Litchfieldia salsa]